MIFKLYKYGRSIAKSSNNDNNLMKTGILYALKKKRWIYANVPSKNNNSVPVIYYIMLYARCAWRYYYYRRWTVEILTNKKKVISNSVQYSFWSQYYTTKYERIKFLKFFYFI